MMVGFLSIYNAHNYIVLKETEKVCFHTPQLHSSIIHGYVLCIYVGVIVARPY